VRFIFLNVPPHICLLAVAAGLTAGYLWHFFLIPIAFALWPLVAWGRPEAMAQH